MMEAERTGRAIVISIIINLSTLGPTFPLDIDVQLKVLSSMPFGRAANETGR